MILFQSSSQFSFKTITIQLDQSTGLWIYSIWWFLTIWTSSSFILFLFPNGASFTACSFGRIPVTISVRYILSRMPGSLLIISHGFLRLSYESSLEMFYKFIRLSSFADTLKSGLSYVYGGSAMEFNLITEIQA